MATPAIKGKLTPDEKSRNISQGSKNFWDSPRGQQLRKERSEQMRGNKSAVKNKIQYLPPPGKEREQPGPGQYTGTESDVPGSAAAAAPGEQPAAAPVKEISNEKFLKVWPMFLVRLHKCFERALFVGEWAGTKIVQRFFPDKRVIMKIDEYTKADAEAESEFSDLLVGDTVPQWIARNKIKAWLIWRATWLLGGTHVKLEDVPEKERKNVRASEVHHKPGSRPGESQGITGDAFD
jgi:hypothetical protein